MLSERAAANGMLVIIALTLVFHLLVVLGIVPYGIVWGGRITSHAQMLRFEAVSIGINLLILGVVAVRAGRLRLRTSAVLLRALLWLMFLLFALNTLGNLLSANAFEKMVFTPVTLLLAVCSLRLAVGKGYAVRA